MFWQKKPSVQAATPAAPPQDPSPKLVGRPAKPPPTPAQVEAQKQMPQEEEDQQLLASSTAPQDPPPTLVRRPAQPASPPPPPAQMEEQQQKPTEEEQHEEVGLSVAAAPPQEPPQRPPKPPAIRAQTEKEQQVSQEGYARQQLPTAAAPPREPPPMLVGRPVKPTPPPAQVSQQMTDQQQALKEQVDPRERLMSVDSTQKNTLDTQRAAPMLDLPDQEPQSVVKRRARLRSESAKIGKTTDEPPKLSRAQPSPQADEKEQLHVSPPAPPLPALARPASPSPATAKQAAVDSEQAAAVSSIEERAKSRRFRQARRSAAEKAAAEQAAAEKAAKPSLTSPPLRLKPSAAAVTNPASWGLMDFEKFAAENPSVTELKRREYFYREALLQKARQEGPQLPPPPLADRPARPQPAPVGTAVLTAPTLAGKNLKIS